MKAIETTLAPKPIGPYSQAIQCTSGLIFISGQIGLDPSTMKLVNGGIESETKQALDNMEAILHRAGVSWKDIVQTELFLTNMADFSKVNEIYSKRFDHPPYPARFTVQVAGLPAGASFEIACVAVKND